MKTLSVALLSLAVALMLTSTGTATVYWEDNFDSYEAGSALAGQTGPTGATWEAGWMLWDDPEIGSMAATDLGGSQGAGAWAEDATGGTANQGNWLSIPKISSGMLYVDYDMHVGSGRQSGPQWWLKDPDNGNMSIGPDWIDNANGGMDPQAGIDLDYDNSNLMWGPEDIGPDTQNIHGNWTFDLDNNTVSVAYTSKEEPGKSATLGPIGYGVTAWAPSEVHIYNHAMSTAGGMGYDNMRIASTPAPSPAGTGLPAGITLWLKGGDFDDASNVWTDSGPDGKHTDNAMGDPTVGVSINGTPTVHFDGDDALHGPNIPLSTGADHTVFMIYANSGTGGRVLSQYAGGSTVSYDNHMTGGNLNGRIGNTSGTYYIRPVDENDTSGPGVHVASTTYYGTDTQGSGNEYMVLNVDGVETRGDVLDGSVAPANDTTQYTIAAIGPPHATEAYWAGGDMAEIITFGRALSSAEHGEVMGYLSAKYGTIPEPSSLVLLTVAGLTLLLTGRRR